MKPPRTNHDKTETDWREALHVVFEMGLPSLTEIERLIDRVERGAWGGIWL